MYEEDGHDNLMKKIREINKIKNVRQCQREVQGVLKYSDQSKIMHIEVPDPNNTSTVRKLVD